MSHSVKLSLLFPSHLHLHKYSSSFWRFFSVLKYLSACSIYFNDNYTLSSDGFIIYSSSFHPLLFSQGRVREFGLILKSEIIRTTPFLVHYSRKLKQRLKDELEWGRSKNKITKKTCSPPRHGSIEKLQKITTNFIYA